MQHPSLVQIQEKICDIAADQLAIPRSKVLATSRLIEDLHCDSLALVELLMEIEDELDVRIPDYHEANAVCKSVFTRPQGRISDLAEVVYLQAGVKKPDRSWSSKKRQIKSDPPEIPFCQLDSKWERLPDECLFDPLEDGSATRRFRRRSDGMRCVLILSAEVEIGTDRLEFEPDARPSHRVFLDSFVIDAEPVSTTAYCRFLNSIGSVAESVLLDWFVLTADDRRGEHHLIERSQQGWVPRTGCEKWPMILVSWYGANAYSLWANGHDWRFYRGDGDTEKHSFLPSEAQWEYAARGSEFQLYPWGNEPADDSRMVFGRHSSHEQYAVSSLPLATVNSVSGMSPFGLHHMAGNVWQWCRDWYDKDFYSSSEASERNSVNRSATGIRSERGGSWVGPAELCRSSYRRGRAPHARGRCLGFRCLSDLDVIKTLKIA